MADFTEAFAGLEDQYGLPRGYLLRSAQIESSLNPNSQSKLSSAGGLFQFIDSTARQYGLKNKYDPYESSNAAARLGSDNASKLRTALGRDPTAAELYLAHQQGGGGAAGLLANPSAPAASIVGRDAVTNNGGNLNMTAGEFANLWLNKFDKGAASAKSTGNTPMPSAMPRIMGGQGQETQLPPILQGQQQGGLAGLFNDPTKMAYMAMIAKGLNPWSDLNPQEMLAQAQRQQLAQSQMFYERQKDARADRQLKLQEQQAAMSPAIQAARDLGMTDPKSDEYKDFMRKFYLAKTEGWKPVTIKKDGEDTTYLEGKDGKLYRPEDVIPGFGSSAATSGGGLPPAPAGMDPKIWKKQGTEAAAKAAFPEQTEAMRTKLATAERTAKDLDAGLDRFQQLVDKHGAEFMPGDAKAKLGTVHADLQMQLKTMYELGALAGPDMAIVDKILEPVTGNAYDPRDWGKAWGTSERTKAQIGEIKEIIKRGVKNVRESYGAHSPASQVNPIPAATMPGMPTSMPALPPGFQLVR